MKKIVMLLLLSVSIFANAQNDSIDPKMAAKQKIESIREQLLAGESFTALAAKYSEDPGSANNGGIYKGVVKGMMVPEFENLAFSLKPGQLSDVFETMYGYHILQVLDRRGEEVDVRHILVTVK